MKRLIFVWGLAICVACGDSSPTEGCSEGDCQDDGNECTVATCNTETGMCETNNVSDGTPCLEGTGECTQGECIVLCDSGDCPRTKRYLTTCTDLLFENSAEVPLDLTVDPASPYTDGEASTDFKASFRLDQGLSELLLGLGIESTEITALEVNVAVSGATMPTTLDLPSEQMPPFTLAFDGTDTVDTETMTETVTPDGVASEVEFLVEDWTIGIQFENQGVPINTRLSPDDTDAIFSCGPLVPADGIRYPQ